MSKPEESRTAQAAEQVEEQSLLNQIVDQGHFSERQRGKDLIREFVTQFLEGSMTASRDTEAMINARIAQIDHLVSIQLNEVLHNAQFQKLEGSWRGLKYLLDQSETGAGLKIKVLNSALAQIRKQATAVDEMEGSITDLQRRKELQEANYKLFAANLEQSRIDEALGSQQLRAADDRVEDFATWPGNGVIDSATKHLEPLDRGNRRRQSQYN